MRILALDPGTEQTGWCILDNDKIVESGITPNLDIVQMILNETGVDLLAIEMVEARGMPVGRETFETVLWAGRFMQAWGEDTTCELIYRREVKSFLCGSAKAKDSNIRQALLDKIGPQGTKKAPGPTYGVKAHIWAALSVAVTAQHKRKEA